MQLKRDQVTLALIFIVLGILLATSFTTSKQSKTTVSSTRKEELISIIHDLESRREALKTELFALRNQLNQYEKQAAANEGKLATFTQEQEELALAAGLVPMTGKGIVITLGDSPSIPLNQNPNDYIIHDSDIRVVTNALWACGAEAMAVNNQRMVSATAIRCAGNTILINSTRCASPYVIYAIGDQKRMLAGLEEDDDVTRLFKHYSQSYGLEVDISKQDDIVIPAYKGSLRIEYTTEVEREGSS